jgi:AcrR family transcriptional regulator
MQRKTKKRELIIETATRLFTKYGAKRVTVEEICSTAHISKMTFYKYFANKIDLVRTIKDDLVTLGFAKYDEINEMDIPYPDKINLMSQWRKEFFSHINFSFIKECISLDEIVDEYKNRFLDNIKKAQAKGEIRPELKPEFIWLVSEKMFEITKEGRWKKIFPDYAQYQDQARTLIFFGMLARAQQS